VSAGQRPSVGRIVHYQSYGTPGGEHRSAPRAATVTATRAEDPSIVDDTTVHLAVLNPTGMFFNLHVPYSETPRPGHWSWPPRV
jgi:hypothetical protein